MQKSRLQYIEVHIEETPSEIKEPSFEEKLLGCEQELDDAMEEYKRGMFPSEGNVTDAFLLRKVEDLKEEYVSLIVEASEFEYSWWLNETVDRLLCGCINNSQNENAEKSQKLMEIFELYRRAKKTRENV